MKEDLTHEELAEQFRLLAEAANDTGDEETVGPVRAPVYVAPSVNEFDADFEAGLGAYDADADDAFETEFGGAFESFGPEPDADDEAVAEESETVEIIPSPAMAPMFEAIEAAAEETRAVDAEAARDRAAGPGFWGFVWAFAWAAVTFGVPTAMIGADALQNQNPALYVAMAAAAIAPALLILSTFSAARESRRTREETRRIAALAEKALAPAEDAQDQARTLGRTVREEIGALQVVVGTALDRFAELEAAAQRNALVFDEAVTSARTGAGALTETLQNERLAFEALTSELHAQTETIGENVSRQIRMMRETSRIVRQEYAAADEALTNHFNAFAASADVMAERTQAIELAAAATKAASVQLDETVMTALEALTQATSITDAARQSADAAAQVAQATAGAVRDTTRRAVADARRVAQLIRNETTAMEESAATTLSRLKDAADEARRASEEAQAAADRHAEGIQRRLSAMAAQAAQPVAAQPALHAPPVAPPAPVEVISNDDVAEEKIRVGERFLRTAYAPSAPTASSGFSRAGEPTVDAPVKPASRFVAPPVEPKAPAPQPKSAAENVLALLTEVGVDAGAVFTTTDLDFIAHRARQGGASRRQAVAAAAPEAIDALKSYFGRSAAAYAYAKAFRAKPELATSNGGKKLLVAYLLVDAALG
jgi:hypothetical protein